MFLLSLLTLVVGAAEFSMERYRQGLGTLDPPDLTDDEIVYLAREYGGRLDNDEEPEWIIERAIEQSKAECMQGGKWAWPHEYALYRMKGPMGFRFSKYRQINAIAECWKRLCGECHRTRYPNVSAHSMAVMCVANDWAAHAKFDMTWMMTDQLTLAATALYCVKHRIVLARAQRAVREWHDAFIYYYQTQSRETPRIPAVLSWMERLSAPLTTLQFNTLVAQGYLTPDGRPREITQQKKKTTTVTHAGGTVTTVTYTIT